MKNENSKCATSKKEKTKVISNHFPYPAKLFLSAVLLLLTNCTSLIYNANLYQDGKTLGKDKLEVTTTFGLTQEFSTGIHDSTTCINFDCNTTREFKTQPGIMFVGGAFLRYGISPNVDIGADAFLSFSGIGGRTYVKIGLSDSLSRWGVALVPVMGYAIGTGSYSEGDRLFSSGYKKEELTSRAFVLELALPISYQISRRASIFFGPRLYNYFYKASYSYSLTQISHPVNESRDFKHSYFAPGLSFGARLDRIHPEVTLVLVDNMILPYLGLGFQF